MTQTVKAMVVETKTRINALIVRSNDLTGALKGWTPKRYAATVKRLGGKTILGLGKRNVQPELDSVRLRIAIAEIPGNSNHHCAVSDCKSAEFNSIFMPFISKHSPNISNLFLTNKDMASILNSIESQGYKVDVKYRVYA